MSTESNKQDLDLKSAEEALRVAVAEHGMQHPKALEQLEQYIKILHHNGQTAQAHKLEQRARLLREMLSVVQPTTTTNNQAAGPYPIPTTTSTQPESEELAKSLYNSRGEHTATVYLEQIYTPLGKHIGHWDETLGVFIDRHGRYLGEIFENDRLAYNTTWQFRHITFGDKGNEGNRAGWGRRRDTNNITLPPGYIDIKMD